MNQSASFPSGVRGGAAPHAPLDSTMDRHFYDAVIQRCVNGVAAAVREFSEKDICICGAPTWSGYTCRACS